MTGDLLDGFPLRHPQADDHPRVLAVLDEWWGRPPGQAASQQGMALLPRLFFQHFTDTSYLVEHEDGEVAGFLIGFMSQAHSVGYVHFVGVHPRLRRSGIGAALYHRFFQEAARRGGRTIQSITSPGNRTSVAFHTRLGFQLQASSTVVDGLPIQLDYDGPGLDRLVFSRDL